MAPPRSKEAKERQLAGLKYKKRTAEVPKVQEQDKTEGLILIREQNTAEHVPEAVKLKALALLAEGKGLVYTANELQLHTHTLCKIRDYALDSDPVFSAAYFAKSAASQLRRFTTRGLDRMIDEVGEMGINQLPVAVAICLDKLSAMQANQGNNLEGSGISMTFNAPVQFNDSLKGLLSAPKAQVIEAKQDAP
jgi:hypothetical protein